MHSRVVPTVTFPNLHEAQSFATTVLELEPCWMDRAVQVPQRILVIGILGDASNHEIMKNGTHFFWGGSNLMQIYGKFEGFPPQ